MNNFDDRVRRERKEFDKRFGSMWKANLLLMGVSAVIGLGVFGFAIWAIIQLMKHFGVI